MQNVKQIAKKFEWVIESNGYDVGYAFVVRGGIYHPSAFDNVPGKQAAANSSPDQLQRQPCLHAALRAHL